jgi:hypothetical protein
VISGASFDDRVAVDVLAAREVLERPRDGAVAQHTHRHRRAVRQRDGGPGREPHEVEENRGLQLGRRGDLRAGRRGREGREQQGRAENPGHRQVSTASATARGRCAGWRS